MCSPSDSCLSEVALAFATGKLKSPRKGRTITETGTPEMLEEWHPTLNGQATTDHVSSGCSTMKAAWLCSVCSRVWHTTPSVRSKGGGCRDCSMLRLKQAKNTPKPGQSLQEAAPELAAEWHSDNKLSALEIKVNSNKKGKWICSICSYEWTAKVGARRGIRATGCPECAKSIISAARRKPKPGQSLFEQCPQLLEEWDVPKNEGLGLFPSKLSWGSGERAWWNCKECNHQWDAPIINRAKKKTGCPKCFRRIHAENIMRPDPGQSFAENFPEAALDWHPTKNGDLNATDVRAGARRKAWWQCKDCQYEWESPVSRRRKSGCLPCSHKRTSERLSKPEPGRSLAEMFPDLMQEWHPEKNKDLDPREINPGNDTKAWWICKNCKNEWATDISVRTRKGHDCSICSAKIRGLKMSIPDPGQSLAELYPNLLAEWDWELNTENPYKIKSGTKLRIWWACSECHYKWQASPSNRALGSKTGCPACNGRGVTEALLKSWIKKISKKEWLEAEQREKLLNEANMANTRGKMRAVIELFKSADSVHVQNEILRWANGECVSHVEKVISDYDPREHDARRTGLSATKRRKVHERDNYTCQNPHCPCDPRMYRTTPGHLHADHIIPWSKGGGDDLDNLQTLCRRCNTSRSNKNWDTFLNLEKKRSKAALMPIAYSNKA